MIKAVILDIDNTMYDYDRGDRLAKMALRDYCMHHLEVDGTVFQRTMQQAGRIMAERIGEQHASVHNRLIRYQCFLELLDKPLFPHVMAMYHTYWDTLLADAAPEPGLIEFMVYAKQRRISIGVGTNMTAYNQYKKLEKLQVTPYINWILTSEEAGVEKPDPVFFRYCLEKCGCEPQECLFIGDGLDTDVKAAVNSGMQALWYTPKGKTAGNSYKEWEEGSSGKYQRIRSFYECLELDLFR